MQSYFDTLEQAWFSHVYQMRQHFEKLKEQNKPLYILQWYANLMLFYTNCDFVDHDFWIRRFSKNWLKNTTTMQGDMILSIKELTKIKKLRLSKKILLKTSDYENKIKMTNIQNQIDKSYYKKYENENKKLEKKLKKRKNEITEMEAKIKGLSSNLSKVREENNLLSKSLKNISTKGDLKDIEYVISKSKKKEVMKAFMVFKRTETFKKAERMNRDYKERWKKHRKDHSDKILRSVKKEIDEMDEKGFTYKGLSNLSRDAQETLLSRIQEQTNPEAVKIAKEYPLIKSIDANKTATFFSSLMDGGTSLIQWGFDNPDKYMNRMVWLYINLCEIVTGIRIGWSSQHYRFKDSIDL